MSFSRRSNLSVSAFLYSEQLPMAGIELIKQFTACRLDAYENPNPTAITGKYLAGWGSSHHRDGRPFAAGDTLTQLQADELLHRQLQQESWPILQDLPGWQDLNENQRSALLSLAHSLGNDVSVLSPRSLLGKALRDRRWYQMPAILSGYYGHNPPACIERRRKEEADLFLKEVRGDQFTVINRTRVLDLTEPQMQGQDVRKLQAALIQRGYEIDIDGIFGGLTQWAVEKFQASVGLPVSGIADVATQRVLHARSLCLSKPYMIGSDVREIQSQLVRMGYAVDINGVFNLRTWKAVVAFQRYFRLTENGVIENETLAKILYLPVTVGVL
ncbi:MAG: peptidoglycan-binding protein [Cyanobacteria bacterium J06631_9]